MGCWLTNRVSGLDVSNIIVIVIIIVVIIIGRWLIIFIVVIIVFNEKTALRMIICVTII